MKHLIAIIFFLSYAVASNGVSLSYMICGKMQSSKQTASTCCKSDKTDKSCCKTEVETKKLSIDQLVKENPDFTPILAFLPARLIELPVYNETIISNLQIDEVKNNGPPLQTSDTQSLLCIFRL